MKKICLLLLTFLVLWACDGNSTSGPIIIGDADTSSSVESSSSKKSSSSKIRSSSSIAPSSSSKVKSSSSVQSSSSATGNSSSSNCSYTEVSPIHFQKTNVSRNNDATIFTFSGGADFNDPCYPEEVDNELAFTDMELHLKHVDPSGQNEETPIKIQYIKPHFPVATINFAEQDLKISDPEKKQCGTFILYIVLYASNDLKMTNKFISIDSVEFVREPEFCHAEPSSSSSAESINPSIELRINTGSMTTSATKGYSFKNDAEVPKEQAQIQISMDELTGELTLQGVNGYKVAKYKNQDDRNYEDDWSSTKLPPSPVHISDFRFARKELAGIADNFNRMAFWVVIGPAFNESTGEDFYAVTLDARGYTNADGATDLFILYCKK